jgi:hypothetical protein
VPKRRKPAAEVFLNIPYDKPFERLFLAYVSGISALGLVPRATLEIPGGARRLDRIFTFIQRCRYSVHDLSRVQLDPHKPRTPRFNMPLELGLSVAWEKCGEKKHTWFVCESLEFRLAKSLSDLSGTDPYIHHGNVRGVFRELCNAFVRTGSQPTVDEMWRVYRDVRRRLPMILQRSGARSVFEARVFRDIRFVAGLSADENVVASRK